MEWTKRHGAVMAEAMQRLLGSPADGSMAFARCLAPDVVEHLATDRQGFVVDGWRVWRVADETNPTRRTITADEAVELRESKGAAALLLVDTTRAGAGMDGILSSGRELTERIVFERAQRIALARLGPAQRKYVREALKRAQSGGLGNRLSPWQRLDFVCHVLSGNRRPGAQLHRIGLWPVNDQDRPAHEALSDLGESRRFVDRLLGPGTRASSRAERIASLRLVGETASQRQDLERLLRASEALTVSDALWKLEDQKHLWVNSLDTERSVDNLLAIELVSWRGKTGRLLKWSGLRAGEDDLPQLVLPWEDDDDQSAVVKLEVRWKARPGHLKKGAADYRVQVLTNGTDEEVAGNDVVHTAKVQEKLVFGREDFAVEEGAVLPVRVVVSAVSATDQDTDSDPLRKESEEFEIVFGEPEGSRAATGKTFRTFSDAVIELRTRDLVTRMTSLEATRPVETKGGFLTWRSPDERKRFRVYRPPLLREIEEKWRAREDPLGRWRVRVRMSGERIGAPEFIPMNRPTAVAAAIWKRALGASRRIAKELFADIGGAGQLYDQTTVRYKNIVSEYLRSWVALLRVDEPGLALAQTVEVQSQAGKLVGLIVLPAHPIRMAWHTAYDNLVLHSVLHEEQKPADVRAELEGLDGAAFPAFLPGLEFGRSFLFGDMLGFHAVGMVADNDEEPKGTLAVLRRALGGPDEQRSLVAPTTGPENAVVLATEVRKYLDSHKAARVLHVHALRAGDGKTVVRALGKAREDAEKRNERVDGAVSSDSGLAYVLELYPSTQERRRGVAGRFISEAQEKRRRRAGTVEPTDRWMLRSAERSGGMIIPNLRWAKKETLVPDSAAHVAFAFDTFRARVRHGSKGVQRPFYAYGLMSFVDREYFVRPVPRWEGTVPRWRGGERHPTARPHSDRLQKLQASIHRLVAANLGGDAASTPMLSTEISPSAAEGLDRLHDLCDWVITLDRNVGLEYFDSPSEDRETFDKFVIDCVPEREDLGCLRLITSTANLEEVQELLGEGLDQMGLSHSRRSAERLIESLKALSGRLAIRLTGGRGPASELVALGLSQMNCAQLQQENRPDSCWTSLRQGFLVPVDDIQDMLPPAVLSARPTSGRGAGARRARPDLVHVRASGKKGLSFQFIEVKYRRHLRAARSPQIVRGIRDQTQWLQKRWFDWYGEKAGSRSLRAVRRARLARILHFYAAKAHRHGLPDDPYRELAARIDRMVEESATYPIKPVSQGNRGWIFCPEHRGVPTQVSPEDWNDVRVFLFGPASLPGIGSGFRVANGHELPHRDKSGPSASEVVTDAGNDEDQGWEPKAPSVSTTTPSAPEKVATDTSADPVPSPRLLLGVDRFGDEARWPLTTKGNPHLLVGGLPGMGKTTCLLNLCRQMMEVRVHPIVFSYHQDIDERLEGLGAPSDAEPLRFIDFDGLGFNPLQVLDRSSPFGHLDVAGTIRDIFMAIYPELGPLQGSEIRRAVKESFDELGWNDPPASLETLKEPPFRRFLEILRGRPKPGIGLKNLLSRLEELDDYGFFHLKRSHGSLWESERPTVIRIHRTKSDVLQTAFSSLILYGLYKNMFQRGISDTITHAIIVDEAHRAARLKLIPTMAKECRKYGVSLILASQEARDFHKSVFSAIANYLTLRMTETDAKALVKNVASSEHQRTLVDRIKQMDRFKAFYFASHGTPPTMLSLPDFSPDR